MKNNKPLLIEVFNYFKNRKKYFLMPIVLLMFVFSILIASASLTDNLLHFYEFDSDLDDTHGTNNMNVDTGSASYSSGYIDNAIDCSDDVMTVSISSGLDNDFTFGSWTKFSNSATAQFLHTVYVDGYSNYYVGIQRPDDNTIAMGFYDGSDTAGCSTTATTYTSGTWYHVAVVVDKTNDLGILYVDGEYICNDSITDIDVPSYSSFDIGHQALPTYNDASYDELGLWNRTLSASEIEEWYDATNGYDDFNTTEETYSPEFTFTYVNGSSYNQTNNVSITGNVTTNVTELTINSTSFYNYGDNVTFNFTNIEELDLGNHTYVINATNDDGNTTIANLLVTISNEEVIPTITIVQPTNETYVYGANTNVSITTNVSSTCKYSTDSGFDYGTEGTVMSKLATGLTHYFEVDATGTLKDFDYYYKCNSDVGGIGSSELHTFKGKDYDWSNMFLAVGDSILSMENSYVDADERFTYLIQQTLLNDYDFWSITEQNNGISGTCLSDDPLCPASNRLIDTYASRINAYNPRFAYIMPNINDNIYGVSVNAYEEDLVTIIEGVRSNAGNTTLLLSTQVTCIEATGGEYAGCQESQHADYSALIREKAIIYEIPFGEVMYKMNHNASYRVDTAHLSVAGHEAVEEVMSTVAGNPENYIMTVDNFNLYHDCNNSVSLFNYTFDTSSFNCNNDTDADWLVVTDITTDSFNIVRADEGFNLTISNKYTPSQIYKISYDDTNEYITADSNGSINDIQFNAISTLTTVSITEAGVEEDVNGIYYDWNSYNITSENILRLWGSTGSGGTATSINITNEANLDLIVSGLGVGVNSAGTKTVRIYNEDNEILAEDIRSASSDYTVEFELDDYTDYIKAGEEFYVYILADGSNELNDRLDGVNTNFTEVNLNTGLDRTPNSGIYFQVISDKKLIVNVTDSQDVEDISEFDLGVTDGSISSSYSSTSNSYTTGFSNMPFVSRQLYSAWNLDKNDNETIADLIYSNNKNANNGTLYGKTLNDGTITGATYDTHTEDMSKFGDYLEFDGSSDYVTKTFQSIDKYTYCAWIYPKTQAESYTLLYGQTLSQYGSYIYNGNFRFRFAGLTSTDIYRAFTYNTWNYACSSYNGTHINAYSSDSGYTSIASTGTITQDNTNLIYLGKERFNRYYLNGSQDEVKIWNTSLTEEQMLQEMTSVGVANPEGIIAYYNFDEGSGTTAYDKNYISTGLTENITAYNFDGIDDYIDLDTVNINGFNELTISLWTNPSSRTSLQQWVYMSGDTYDNDFIGIMYSTANIIYWIRQSGVSKQVTVPNTDVNEWNLITTVFDDGEMYLYKNNQLLDDLSSGFTEIIEDDSDFVIGRRGTVSTSSPFNGSIARPKIYNRVLSELEIIDLYNRELNEETYPFIQNNVTITTTNAVGEESRPYFDNSTSYSILNYSNLYEVEVNPYTKINATDFNNNSNLHPYNATFNNITYNSLVNNLLYVPLTQNQELTLSKNGYENRTITINKFVDTTTSMINSIKEFILNIVSYGSYINSYIYDDITLNESIGKNKTILVKDIFTNFEDTKDINFTIEPLLTYYLETNEIITANKSIDTYNITVEQYKLYLTFSETVNGTYVLKNNSVYTQYNFTNSIIEKNMVNFDLGKVVLGFGKDNPDYTGNQTQKFEFINDYYTKQYADIYVLPSVNDDLYVSAFEDIAPVENVYINLYQYTPNGTPMLISKLLTNSEGKAHFQIDNTKNHYITYYKDGYSLIKTNDFIPKDTVYTDNTQPLILTLSKDFTEILYGRIINKGSKYKIFYNSTDTFNFNVQSKVDETLYYKVNDDSFIRMTTDSIINKNGLYTNYGTYTHNSTNDVTIKLYDGEYNLLTSWTYIYHEEVDLLDVPEDIKDNKTFLVIMFIGLIIISGIIGYSFNSNENIGTNVFMIGLIIFAFINLNIFGVAGAVAILYLILNNYKQVVNNE